MVYRTPTASTEAIRKARDFLFAHATDYDGAIAGFEWPQLEEFNFALDWFDVIAGEHPDRNAIMIANESGEVNSWTYGDLSGRSDQVANWFVSLGMKRGDSVIVMLPNTIELWETILGVIKAGGVVIPTYTLLSPEDIAQRAHRAHARFSISPGELEQRLSLAPDDVTKICVGAQTPAGWINFTESEQAKAEFEPDGPTPGTDTCLYYFTSGTTAYPKLVRHTQTSYPVGHLTTMYWLGLRPGDIHFNLSSPGWAKHAWSSVFPPFLAESTVFMINYDRFHPGQLLPLIDQYHITTFCVPPTAWRMLIQTDMSIVKNPPRELRCAGEPLNAEVISQVRKAWGETIRDGYGQTEMTCSVSNSPGQPVKDGSMGRAMPGYTIQLWDTVEDQPSDTEGEICLDLSRSSYPLMTGYVDDPERNAEAYREGYYHTGDVAMRDSDGYLTFIGRSDDVFKASGYKISPFELESILLEHPLVAEVAVVPSPDEVRGAVPKAFICLVANASEPDRDIAVSIFQHSRQRLAGFQLVRIVEFVEDLPKTISGKIRRVELREGEADHITDGTLKDREFRERDIRKAS